VIILQHLNSHKSASSLSMAWNIGVASQPI